MSLQSLIMLHFGLTRRVMSGLPSSFWHKRGERLAVRMFRTAAYRVPAYRDFLSTNGVSPDSVRTIEDFRSTVPVIDKKGYLGRLPLNDYCVDGVLHSAYTIETSSGNSGTPMLWPRTYEEDFMFPRYMEHALRQFYQIDKRSTLVILTLALGTWTSGEKMAQAIRTTAAKRGYRLTVMTPGVNLQEAVELARLVSPHYEQTVIVGYPPFVKNVIDEGVARGIDWPQLGVSLGLGGEGYSEQWREYMARRIGVPENDLMGISGGYGAADLGMSVGREYPITVLIRKLAHKDGELAEALFGENGSLPSFLQYNPASFYIEEVDNELVFSVKAGIPLVRYNIHDRGGVIRYDRAMEIVRDHGYDVIKLLRERGYDRRDVWRLPFFYVFGRSDGTVCISGLNVYPENVEAALYLPETEMIGSYKLGLDTDEDMNARLCIWLELCSQHGHCSDRDLAALEKKLHAVFFAKLTEVNAEFRRAVAANPVASKPVIRVHRFGEGPFAEDKTKIKARYVR